MHNTASCLARPNAAPASPFAARSRSQVDAGSKSRCEGTIEDKKSVYCPKHASMDGASRANALALVTCDRAQSRLSSVPQLRRSHHPCLLHCAPRPRTGNAPRGSSAGAAGAAVAGGVSLTGV
jgi:hypothetical protein